MEVMESAYVITCWTLESPEGVRRNIARNIKRKGRVKRMLMFEFMSNAFFLLVGTVCITLAVLIATGCIYAILNARQKIKRGKSGDKSGEKEIPR